MKITESVVTNLANVNLAQKVIMNRKYENQVNGLIRRFTQISKTPQFQGLVGTHSYWMFVVLSLTFHLGFQTQGGIRMLCFIASL